ncbi:MAG: 30S ribosomal protein S3 [Myxococcota bacterium]|jgi:small subunit ribosomal protein S3|nr:30S ribosomal protein S3 [Myxococcota bacterium]
MGQKVHPVGFRLGIVNDWQSKWYFDKGEYQQFLHEDIAIRRHLKKKLFHAGISRVTIERPSATKVLVFVHAAKPGIIIGKRASGLDALKSGLQKMTTAEVFVNIIEVRRVETDAVLVAENIAAQLVKRVSFRRAMKKAVTQARRSGALGIKVMCAGRLGGSEMSRREWYREGRVPLHTLRAEVDYGLAEARCSYGIIGVKVWIFKGEKLPGDEEQPAAAPHAS